MRRWTALAFLPVVSAGCAGVAASGHFTYRGPADLPEGVLRFDGYYFSEVIGAEGGPEAPFTPHTGTTSPPQTPKHKKSAR